MLGKPLTETAPGTLEGLRWVGPLRSNCLLRLNKPCKNETVTTTSTTTEGKQQLLQVSLCNKAHEVLCEVDTGAVFLFSLFCSVCLCPFSSCPVSSCLILLCPVLIIFSSPCFYLQTSAFRGGICRKIVLSVALPFPAFLIDHT